MRYLFLLTFVSFTLHLSAQASFEMGALPSVNFNTALQNDWRINAKIESRQSFYNDDLQYNYVLTDISSVVAKKISPTQTIAGGYLLRIADGEINHRFIQQYSWVQPLLNIRIGHRLVTDQTIENQYNVYRLRYRITPEIALNGQSADVNEWYIKINNEYLQSIENGDYDIEIRLVPLLGYIINPTNRMEVGVDYRVNEFLNSNTRQRLWGSLNYYITL